jgi:hypothetical protein
MSASPESLSLSISQSWPQTGEDQSADEAGEPHGRRQFIRGNGEKL